MRVCEETYEGYMSRAHEIMHLLRKKAPPETCMFMDQFVEEIDITNGVANFQMDWNDKANVRGRFNQTIPAMLGEAIVQTYHGIKFNQPIQIAYDRTTQVVDCIDHFVGDRSYQVKVVKFIGTIHIYDDYIAGIPDIICLVDIDMKMIIEVTRSELTKFVGKQISLTKLEDQLNAQIINTSEYY